MPRKKRSPDAQRAAIKRDGRCLWCCTRGNTLVGHHLHSWGSSGDDSPENIATLCFKCHDDAEHGFLDVATARGTARDHLDRAEGSRVWHADDVLRLILAELYGYRYYIEEDVVCVGDYEIDIEKQDGVYAWTAYDGAIVLDQGEAETRREALVAAREALKGYLIEEGQWSGSTRSSATRAGRSSRRKRT